MAETGTFLNRLKQRFRGNARPRAIEVPHDLTAGSEALRAILEPGLTPVVAGAVRQQRSRRRRFVRSTLLFLAGVLIISGIAFGALIARLSFGPIVVDGLGVRIADALDQRFGNNTRFSFGQTTISNSPHGPTLAVERLVVSNDGQTMVEAPRAQLSLSLPRLLAGEVRPKRLEVFDLEVRLLVQTDGSVALSAGTQENVTLPLPKPVDPAVQATLPPEEKAARRSALAAQAAAALAQLLDMATTDDGGPMGAVEHIAIHRGRLIVDDRTADRSSTFEQLEIAFDKTRGAAVFTIAAQGPNGPVRINAQAQGAAGGERTLDVELRDLSFDEIVLAAGIRRPGFDTDMALSMKFKFSLDAAGAISLAQGRFGAGAGFLRLNDPDHEPMFIDEIAGGAHWDPAQKRIIIDPIRYFAGETRFTVAGTIDPPAAGEDDWILNTGLTEPGGFAPERPGEKFLVIDQANVTAKIAPSRKMADISSVELKGPELGVALKGSVDWTNGPHIRLGASTNPTNLRALVRLWPTQMAAPARTWFIHHARGATIQSGSLAVDFDAQTLLAMRFDRAPPDSSLLIDFALTKGSVDVLAGLPPAMNVDGAGRITGRTAYFAATAATLETAPGRRLTLQEGNVLMPSNDGSASIPVRVDVKLSGAVDAIADLLSKDSIKSYAALPLEASTLKGQVDGRLKVDFAIGSAAKPDNTKINVNATVTNFSAERLIGKEKLDNATINVLGDTAGIKVTGTGRMFGQPATLDLRKGVGQAGTASVGLTLDEAARTKAGIALPGVGGAIGAKITASLDPGQLKAQVDLDLARTSLDNPLPGLSKAAGKPGRATFTVVQRDNGFQMDQLNFEAGGASAKGVIDLTGEGGLVSARFSQLRLSPGDDMRAEVQKTGDALKVVVRASAIDVRPYLKQITRAAPDEAAKGALSDIDLDLKSPIVTGYGKQVLTGVDLKLARKGPAIRTFTMSGLFGRSPLNIGMLKGENGGPQISIVTPDAGALLSFTDLYARMDGGTMAALIQIEGSRTTGVVKINKFALRDEPALKRLVIDGNPRTDAQGVTRIDPNQVPFDRLQVVFSRSGSHVDLRDGLMNGPNIGLTVEGSIDDARDTMNLNGTFIPAYTVNNFFSKIPLVGLFLGGGWNEGLFAINYRIGGKFSAPVLSVNPLSAVAPGFLRKILGAMDGAGQFPSERPATPGAPSAPSFGSQLER